MNNSIYPKTFLEKHLREDIDCSLIPKTSDIEKRTTQKYGIGIFALRPFYRGETIGYFIAEPTKKLLQHTLQRLPDDNLHDPYFVGFLLHSCNPNIIVDMHLQKVFCIRDIANGEPLLMDYAATEDKLFQQFACSCQAPNCRQWICGRNEVVSETGQIHLQKHRQRTSLTPSKAQEQSLEALA